MDSSISYNDNEHIESHLSKSQVLEMAYQETLRNTDLIIKDESARRLRLRILLLENENDDLHEQLAFADDRIDGLEEEGEEVRAQLEFAKEDSNRKGAELRTRTRELKNLEAELTSMNGVTMDSTRLLTEKLAFSRELAILKPELEHLRSQGAYQQTVLSEKLALERHVNTLEVELETEKRASKRAAEKNTNKERELELQQELDDLRKELAQEKREREKWKKDLEKGIEAERRVLKRAAGKLNSKEREIELQKQLEDLQFQFARQEREAEKIRMELEKDLEAERCISKRVVEKSGSSKERYLEVQQQIEEIQEHLARERREREKARKDAERDLTASEARKTILESKIDQMSTKLRATREELKECQAELSQARAAAVKVGAASGGGSEALFNNSRKRGALEMSSDVAIGTPDGVAVRGKRPAMKRGRMDQTMVREKSTFSITPYLNRTLNVGLDSPFQKVDSEFAAGEDADDRAKTIDPQEDTAAQQEILGNMISSPVETKANKKPAEKRAPAEKKVLGEPRKSVHIRKPAAKKLQIISSLERVAEEESDETVEQNVVPSNAKSDAVKPQPPKELKKSVEEMEPKKKKRKLLGGGRTLFDEEDGEATKRPTKINLGQPKLPGKFGLGGAKGASKGGIGLATGFGAFSPLKKDRRGIGASFLA